MASWIVNGYINQVASAHKEGKVIPEFDKQSQFLKGVFTQIFTQFGWKNTPEQVKISRKKRSSKKLAAEARIAQIRIKPRKIKINRDKTGVKR